MPTTHGDSEWNGARHGPKRVISDVIKRLKIAEHEVIMVLILHKIFDDVILQTKMLKTFFGLPEKGKVFKC